jgi:D-alanyl-lipoteichoic acid acyltransferase DltB (MBOAT superfamily)
MPAWQANAGGCTAARVKASLVKAGLTSAGFALLYGISQSVWAPVALLATALAACAFAAMLNRVPRGRAHRAVARLAVPAAFVALVGLNVTGLIGTLTGAQSTLLGGASSALIAMPFYLLAAAAFVADTAGGKLRPGSGWPTGPDFLLYMALPFKLLAGPLESPRLLEQIRSYRFALRPARLVVAWTWLALGAFMKYVIANRLDPARHLVDIDPVRSFMTAGIFELKFYFDFAGYSFMAYGAAIAFGLRISPNFNHPFLAHNVVLFWRRWHMSLGRFLSRYILEPNLSLWQGRTRKLVFASAIFLVSAMWHGGTANYLMWGCFHGLCYFAYGQWLRHRDIGRPLGLLAMLLFFVFGRMLAVDADGARLLLRLQNFLDPAAYLAFFHAEPLVSDAFLLSPERRALVLAGLFIALEAISERRQPRPLGYHLLRRPVVALALTLLFVCFGLEKGALLYARL